MLKRKWGAIILALYLIVSPVLTIQAEDVFTDINNNSNKDQIIQLYQKGLVKGVGNHLFRPDSLLSNAEALQLFVNVFQLNLDRFRFIKAPLATDYFANANNDAWYSDAFIKASVNGIEADVNLIPKDMMTRESFYQLLINQMENQYGLPMIKLVPVDISDEDDMDILVQGIIQRGISYGVIKLNEDGSFDPKGSITRGEAANAIVKVLDYMKTNHVDSMNISPFIAQLNTKEGANEITFQFDLYNQTDFNQVITYSSSQSFDINIYNSKDEQVYNWSSNKSFMMMIQDVTINKGSFVSYVETWDYKDLSGELLPVGTYKVVFETQFEYEGEPVYLSNEVMVDISE